MRALVIHVLLMGCLASSAWAFNQRDANPIDELPPYISKINDWGQRADFSHDGKHTLVESSRQFIGQKLRNPVQYTDIWKLSLDGRFIAFPMAKLGDPAGVGRGLFLLDIEAMEAARKEKTTSR